MTPADRETAADRDAAPAPDRDTAPAPDRDATSHRAVASERVAAAARAAGPAARAQLTLRDRLERVRVAWRSVVQASVAAGLAWLVATEIFGHQRPFFAPVAAIITLGLTVSERGRRAWELAAGVALGIAVGDLLVLGIGVGPAQLALVVALATAVALFVGRGQMFASQAAVSAALVATLQPPTGGISFARFLDALVGGALALVVNALLLPADPVRMVRGAARPVLEELAATLEDIADAMLARDRELADAALARASEVDELSERFTDAVSTGRETMLYAPPRRGSRDDVDLYAGAAPPVDLAVRNVRVLARGVIRALLLDDNVPPDIAGAVRELAAAVRALDGALADGERASEVVEPALRAAAQASAVLERTGNLSVSVIVGQIRSTAADLLAGVGYSYDDAAAAVRGATSP